MIRSAPRGRLASALVKKVASLVLLSVLGVLAIVAASAVLGLVLPDDSATGDALMVAVSIIGVGAVFATPSVSFPVRWEDPLVRRVVAAKLVGVAAMFVGGAAVRHLFGPEDAGYTLLLVAVALWLPAVALLVLGAMIRIGAEEERQGES